MGLGESMLCLKQSEVKDGEIFEQFEKLNGVLEKGGNEFVTIQDISKMFRFKIKRIGPSLNSMNVGRMRANDINIDGYPDLFLTLEFEDNNGNSFF
jgi:hypothetical protein